MQQREALQTRLYEAELQVRIIVTVIVCVDVYANTVSSEEHVLLLPTAPAATGAVPACLPQLEGSLNALEERLRSYNASCHRLGLLPASAKRAGGVAYDMALQRAASSQGELVSGDIKVCSGEGRGEGEGGT